jgi:hypothetical protein
MTAHQFLRERIPMQTDYEVRNDLEICVGLRKGTCQRVESKSGPLL